MDLICNKVPQQSSTESCSTVNQQRKSLHGRNEIARNASLKRKLNKIMMMDITVSNASTITLNLLQIKASKSNPDSGHSKSSVDPHHETAASLKKRHTKPGYRRITSSLHSTVPQRRTSTAGAVSGSIERLDPQVNDASANLFMPYQYFLKLLDNQGIKVKVLSWSSPELEQYFIKPSQHDLDSYTQDVVGALRMQDLPTLKAHLESKISLQCCNRFGEGLVHMACRRGFTQVVEFLLSEAKVSLRVRDDYGRTPAHDACWTCNPELQLMKLILERCPELLLVGDKRGDTPLQYVRKEHAVQWRSFLEQNQDLLKPKHDAFLH